MKQTIKGLTGLVLAAILLTAAVFAADIPAAPSGHAVLDQAGVLSEETINTVDGYNNALASTGAEIGVLTVDFTGNLSIDDYALQVFNEWGVGDSKKENGVLFLLVIGDENYYCTLGTGLEGEITYSRLKNLLNDYAEPSFAKGDYDGCVTQFTGAVYSELCALYGVTPGEGQPQPQPVERNDSDLGEVFLILVAAAVLVLIVVSFSGRGGPGGPGGGGGRGRDVVFWPVFLGGWGRPRHYHRPPPGGFGGGFGSGGFGGGGFGGGFGGGGGGFGGFGGGGSRGGGAGRG